MIPEYYDPAEAERLSEDASAIPAEALRRTELMLVDAAVLDEKAKTLRERAGGAAL